MATTSNSEHTIPIKTGHEKYIEISKTWSGPALLIMRVLLGWHFFFAGITKVMNPGWSAKGYLLNAVGKANPFTGFFHAMANSAWMPLVDVLNMWGLTLVGIALIIGFAVRWSAFWGAVMMWFYWASSLPLAHSIFVDDHWVYVALLFALGAFGAGRYYGIDKYIEDLAIVQNNAWLKYLLG
ncbi:MAG: DoxX family protein [Halobacteriaceae archaeon]